MDASRFDRLTRVLTGTANRRGALRLIAAGLAGGMMVRQAGEAGNAAQVDPRCPPELGYDRCGRWGTCTNLMADDYNCGACGVECPLVQRCVDGVCAFVDPPFTGTPPELAQ